ncbi:MAG: hypothetical protein UV80_C0001G0059 [Candidatus Peregrinibacteria bacterium GW2011_GWF2_43_17]|nr:MAG: hypothetical protein UV80_C0001G0059 [Candidatus Peregrinibacteria bacterium GW2011_GWF2_43_17]KKT20494.1 MAG: hypothetical protein UW03_C0003G0030 [Candidatus Peregrinibacteria bacterium GW2011_GWA2_43_8]HAU40301.1 hypothetical protein [Candidatus Peregrinibacteria bacterium]
MKKILILLTFAVIALNLVTPSLAKIANATANDTPTEEEDTNTVAPTIPKPDLLPGATEGASQQDVQDYFKNQAIPGFIAGFIGIVGVVSFVGMLIGGIRLLTAYGNDEQVGSAKKTIIFALVGLLLAIFSYAIVSIIGSLNLDANIFKADTAQAEEATLDDKLNELLPSEEELIEKSPNSQRASLPGGDLIKDVLPKAINIILYITSTIVFVALVYSGILYVTARGNEEDVKKATNIILYSIVGIIVVALSYALVSGISNINF